MKFSCLNCQKNLSSKYRLKTHQDKCNGLNSLQCEICKKEFKNRHTKSVHKKNQVCIITPEMKTTLLDITNQNTDYLPEHIKKEFSRRYLSPRVLKEFHRLLHFNPEHPENHIIAKTNKSKNEYHVRFPNGVFQIKFKELCFLLKPLYETIDGILIEPWGDWKVDENGVNLGEDILQKEDRNRQRETNLKAVLYQLTKEHPEIAEKLRKESQIPLIHPLPFADF